MHLADLQLVNVWHFQMSSSDFVPQRQNRRNGACRFLSAEEAWISRSPCQRIFISILRARCTYVCAGAGGAKTGASAQEVLAKGLKEANRKRAHQQVDRLALTSQTAKSLVDEAADARESLLSSALAS